MEDRTFSTNNHPTNGISDTFRQFIEALAEEVVINGEPFDAQKKWLRKYSEAEVVDYTPLNLDELFADVPAKELSEKEQQKEKKMFTQVLSFDWSEPDFTEVKL